MITTPNIQKEIEPLRIELLNHEVYTSISTLDDLQIFLEHHVFAVWDFMSLLKALQRELTCVSLPWIPQGNPATRKLINEIVLDEETDQDQDGNAASHFELYLNAMDESQSDTTLVKQFVALIQGGAGVQEALEKLNVPESIKEFVLFTFSVIDTNEPHKIAAAFTFGREDLIPEMFTVLVEDLNKKLPDNTLDQLVYYLNRHIELDADVHGPLAMRMIDELCGNDINKWNECVEVSKAALEKRITLWDGILKSIQKNKVQLV